MQTENELDGNEINHEEAFEAINCVKEALIWVVSDLKEMGIVLPNLDKIQFFLEETDKLLTGHI